MKNIKNFFYFVIFFFNFFFLINHSFAVDITANTTISSDTTYDSLVVKSGYTLTINAVLTVTGDAVIENGGIITHSATSSTSSNLIVGGTLDINPGGKFDVSYKGTATTCGASTAYKGACHGGYGISNSNVPYGNLYNPITVGSVVRGSYPGGGLARMTVGNLINNGSILANGTSGNTYGNGAGGSINITVNGNLSGTGIYQANGGNGSIAGGGGRISIKYNSVFDLTSLKNNTSATGPGGAGEGTIYIKDLSTGYDILIVKGDGGSLGTNITSSINSIKEIIFNNALINYSGGAWNIPDSFYISNSAKLITNSSSPLSKSGTLTISTNASISSSASLTTDDLLLTGGILYSYSTLSISNDLTVYNGTLYTSSGSNIYGSTFIKSSGIINNDYIMNVSGDLTIQNGGTYTHSQSASTASNLIVGGTLDINPGGKFDVSYKGTSTTGGATTAYIGATHGGYGISNSKVPYGDIYNPITVGSVVRGSYPGGGLARMTVGNLINNGSILANGTSGNTYGNGAGGSINITVNGNLSGTGIYQANGGNGSIAGGGGRISIKYNSVFDLTSLKNNTSATGPGGAGEGTIYIKDLSTGYDILIVKGDGGSLGTNITSSINSIKEIIFNNALINYSGGAWNIPDSFYISNSAKLITNSSSPLSKSGTLTISTNASISSSASLTTDDLLLTGGILYSYSTLSISNDLTVYNGTLYTYSGANIYGNTFIKSSGVINNDYIMNVSGDLTIQNLGKITHSQSASTASNLIVGGTLTINPGGKFDVSYKGTNTTGGAATVYIGATHGGYGITNSNVPYGDIYNPIDVGSVVRGSYPGGGLARMTVGNLINNGSILANGTSGNTYGNGAGGSINITVNGNLSGTGIYQANGGNGTYAGGGGRVAIKYNTISDLNYLENNLSVTGPGTAGEGTIYLKDLTTGYDILLIKGDGGSLGTSTSIDLNNIDDVFIDGGGLTISGFNWDIPKSFEIKNGGFLTTNASYPLSVSGTLIISSGSTFRSNSILTVDDLLLNNGTVVSSNTFYVNNDLTLSGGTFNSGKPLFVYNDLNMISGTFNNTYSGSVFGNAYIKGLFNNSTLFSISGNATILNLGNITYSSTSNNSFSNLIVGGTLTINPGGKYDVSNRGINSTGSGAQYVGGTHGGVGAASSKSTYGDIYNPTNVGSYGYNSSRYGGGLVNMTVGNLINNGSVLANGTTTTGYGAGAGGSININVNGNISGTGTYQAIGGGSSSTSYAGGGGRVAIKYNSVSDLVALKNNIYVTGPGVAGEGTIYLKDISTGSDYLFIKGDGVSGNYYTSFGTGYTDYYFDVIEVTNGARLYKVGTQNVVSSSCIVSGTPVGTIDPLINCTGDANFKYYDLSVGINNFSSIERKYEFFVAGPSGGASLMTTSNGVINGNGNIPSRIKIIKVGTYTITFNLYDGNLANSQIFKTMTKTVIVKKN
ncbi:MAG: hypothetical protein PHN31_03525 [Candidatus Gracilibacteria bacterium]|nr:hypothetical protein [Candidatus Gracilibacteria bacterium]